jgi:hypothetical protein
VKSCGKKEKQKSLRNLSKSEALIKEGGYLLSRIALQYHRRKMRTPLRVVRDDDVDRMQV